MAIVLPLVGFGACLDVSFCLHTVAAEGEQLLDMLPLFSSLPFSLGG